MRDELSGVNEATLEYRFDDLNWMSFVNEALDGWQDTDEFPHLTQADGIPLQVRVRDRAGNAGVSQEIQLMVDLESPLLTVTSQTHPRQEIWYANPQPTVELTVDQDFSGMAALFWEWDNRPEAVPIK
jgi:hypothetical protein